MPSVAQIIQMRQRRRHADQRQVAGRSGGRFGISFATLISLAVVLSGLALSVAYVRLTYQLPNTSALPALLDSPGGLLLQPTRLYDRRGEHILRTLEDPGASGRQYLTRSQISPWLVEAVLASTDPDFWPAPGYAWQTLLHNQSPLLAQKLVADILLDDESPGIEKDLRQALLASQAVNRFGRDKILEWYLNSAQFGPLVYGADAAARAYLDKSASSLTIAEAAWLAAAAQTPEINPVEADQITRLRQQDLIQEMLRQNRISSEQALQATQAKISLKHAPRPQPDSMLVFTDLALDQLSRRISLAHLERGGFRIQTTLDYDLQTQSACAAAEQIRRLEGQSVSGPAEGACPAARLLPTLNAEPGKTETDFSTNILLTDPASGQILVMVGDAIPGRNPAYPPGHPPGTLLSPFIYLTAFARGLSPASLAWDIPSSLPIALQDHFPKDTEFHGPVRLRTALANDYLAPALELLAQVGPENVALTAQQSGWTSIEPAITQQALQDYPPFASGQVTPLEVAQAYGLFANQGILAGQILPASATNPPASSAGAPKIEPITILQVATSDGRIWMDCGSQPVNCSLEARPVVSKQLAYLVTHVLSDESARWPSLGHPNALEIGLPAAAKAGQAPGNAKDAWVAGYTPHLLVTTWVGEITTSPASSTGASTQATSLDQNLSMQGAMSLWHALIQYASRNLPSENWSAPSGIVNVQVCDPSGLLPTRDCPNVVGEVFLTGQEPTQLDNLYQSYQINRETGRLATIFTPASLVQTRTFLVPPPAALSWAQQSGLALPPTTYDIIESLPDPLPNVHIDSPAMFSYIKGKVSFRGSASGQNFSFFRLQAGKGLFPQEWIQLGQDMKNSVSDGLLGEWDASGLSGLYVVQLLVVRRDQRVETASIQVTVDNQPPQALALYPANGQVINQPASGTLVFQGRASDDLALDRIELYLDGSLISTLQQSPFAVSWKAQSGSHKLVIRAYDMAGNYGESTVTFSVTSK